MRALAEHDFAVDEGTHAYFTSEDATAYTALISETKPVIDAYEKMRERVMAGKEAKVARALATQFAAKKRRSEEAKGEPGGEGSAEADADMADGATPPKAVPERPPPLPGATEQAEPPPLSRLPLLPLEDLLVAQGRRKGQDPEEGLLNWLQRDKPIFFLSR